VKRAQEVPPRITLEAGDLLRVGATGGRVDEGECLVCLGAFRTGFLPWTGASSRIRVRQPLWSSGRSSPERPASPYSRATPITLQALSP
jgi:hypothetical protein